MAGLASHLTYSYVLTVVEVNMIGKIVDAYPFDGPCTIRNTITIVIVGPIAREIAVKNNVSLRRSASIMDTMSCCVQGIIPYGAHLLAAMAIAGFTVSPIEIISHLYYPFLIGIFTLLYILFPQWKQLPKGPSRKEQE